MYTSPSATYLNRTERAIKYTYNAQSNTWSHSAIIVEINPTPFSEGNLRRAHLMKDFSVDESQSKMVAKFPKDDKHSHRSAFFRDVECQMVASQFADAFNERNPPKKVSFLPCFVLELCDRPGRPLCNVESYAEGVFRKHNNNYGFVDKQCNRSTPQAFSHFTYHASNNELLVVDIQGVENIFTDPQIHSVAGNDFGLGNLGKNGMKRFLESHQCNEICQYLELPLIGTLQKDKNSTIVKNSFNEDNSKTKEVVDNSDLINSIENNTIGVLQRILVYTGIDPKGVVLNGNQNLLFLACRLGHAEILSYLIDLGLSIDWIDDDGRSPLFEACFNNNMSCTKLLLHKGINCDLISNKKEVCIGIAISHFNADLVELLVKYADLNTMHKGESLLAIAVKSVDESRHHDQSIIIDLLLENGIDVNLYSDTNGFPAISNSLYDLSLTKFLISKGASCTVKSNNNSTLLFLPNLSSEILKFLVLNGVDPNVVNDDGDTAFSVAIKNGDLNMAQNLHSIAKPPNEEELAQLLMSVCSLHFDNNEYHFKVLEYLVSLGGDPKVFDKLKFSDTPFCRALLSHHHESAELLLSCGIDISPDDIDYALFLLCSQPFSESLFSTVNWVLCELDPNPTVPFGRNNETAFDVSLLGGSCAIAGAIYDKCTTNDQSLKKIVSNADNLLCTLVQNNCNHDVIDFVCHLLNANVNCLDSNGVPIIITSLLNFNYEISMKLVEMGSTVDRDLYLWAFSLICCGFGEFNIETANKTISFFIIDLQIDPFDQYLGDNNVVNQDLAGLPFVFQTILSGNVNITQIFVDLGVEISDDLYSEILVAILGRTAADPSVEPESVKGIVFVLQAKPNSQLIQQTLVDSFNIIQSNGLLEICFEIFKFLEVKVDSFELILSSLTKPFNSRYKTIATQILGQFHFTEDQIFKFLIVTSTVGNFEFLTILFEFFSTIINGFSSESVSHMINYLAKFATNPQIFIVLNNKIDLDPHGQGNSDVIVHIFEPSTTTINQQRVSPIFEALYNENDLQTLRALNEIGFDLKITDQSGNSILHQSILIGKEDLACELVRLGLDIHLKNHHNVDPYSICSPSLRQKLLLITEEISKEKTQKTDKPGVDPEYAEFVTNLLVNSEEISPKDKKAMRNLRNKLNISRRDHEAIVLNCGWTLEQFDDGCK
ncbi:hypothetical protein P9112_007354 [Eukaryota sp. TZLM1-RC]